MTSARTAKRRGGPGRAVRILVAVAIAAWAVRSLVAAPFTIPSPSMLPVMLPGDYLLVAKWPYGVSRFAFPGDFPPFRGRLLAALPERGDIVVFRDPAGRGDWVKRVVGLPGDTVALAGGRLFLNGNSVPRAAVGLVRVPVSPNTPCPIGRAGVRPIDGGAICGYRAFRETLGRDLSYVTIDQYDRAPGDDFGPVRVPAGHLFLLGDNRDDSADSRFAVAAGGIGMVPVERLVGRAGIAFWSTDGSADIARPASWFPALRASRIGQGYQP
jgi:signal peptidase I